MRYHSSALTVVVLFWSLTLIAVEPVPAVLSQDAHWASKPYKYSLGYEASTSGATMLGQNVLVFGSWLDDQIGGELFLGFTKSSDSISQAQTTATTPLTGAATVTTVYSGITNSLIFSVGAVPKLRIYRNDWFQAYFGTLIGVTYVGATSYKTGTVAVATANPARPNYQSITETSFGYKSVTPYFAVVIAPRIGTELFIKSLPNVAIGFSGGMVTTVTGDVDTRTNIRTASYTVVDGVTQTPTTESDSNVVTRSRPGVTGTTVALAGQLFNLFGSFTIHYVW